MSAPAESPQARRDLDAEPRVLELGPAHPSFGSLRLALALEGDTITAMDVEVGRMHRGFEKECERRRWLEALPYTERLDERSPLFGSLAFCLAVERQLGAEPAERGQWLRVLAAELSRAADHLLRLGALARALGADLPLRCSLAAGEPLGDLVEGLTGARVTAGFVRPGGVRHPLPAGFPQAARRLLPGIRAALEELAAGIADDAGARDALEGQAVLSGEDAVRQAVTGPLLRASGVARDLRKDEPCLVYDRLDFDVPVGSVGDNHDRFLVCVEETRQSLRIVEQCLARLEALGAGPFRSDDPRLLWPPTAEPVESAAPGLPAGETYQAVESANGELGFYLVSDGGERPVKLRCRPPSFLHLQALAPLLRGAALADLAPTFALLNVAFGECDR